MKSGDIIEVNDDNLDLCENCRGRVVKIVNDFFVIFEVIAITTPKAWELYYEDCLRITSTNEIRGTTLENVKRNLECEE
jgi:hypothetical protein